MFRAICTSTTEASCKPLFMFFPWSWDGDTFCQGGIEKSDGGRFNMKLDPNKNCALSLGMVTHQTEYIE